MKNLTKHGEPVEIRGIYRLGSFCDNEKNTEPSMTDPSQDEPIEALVARMIRGELINAGPVPVYDNIPPGMSAADAFAAQSRVEKRDFDLADAPEILAAAAAASASLKPAAPGEPPPVKPAAPGEPPPVKGHSTILLLDIIVLTDTGEIKNGLI